MPLNLRCRFAPNEHGTFVNAVRLQQHYQQVHADVYQGPAERATCPECGAKVSPTYLPEHRRLQHGAEPFGSLGNPSKDPRQWRCNIDGREFATKDSLRGHFRKFHRDEYARGWQHYATRIAEPSPRSNGLARVDREVSRVAPSHVGPWHVDDIVLPVVNQLAAPKGVVAVSELAALLAWRDATALFLAEFQR